MNPWGKGSCVPVIAGLLGTGSSGYIYILLLDLFSLSQMTPMNTITTTQLDGA